MAIALFSIAVTVHAKGYSDSLLNSKQPQFTATEKRQFAQLNKLLSHGNYFTPASTEPEFTDKFLQTYSPTDTGTATSRAKAQQTLDEVERNNHYIDFISPNDLTELPVGLKKKLGNTSVTIGISKAKFINGYTELTVFCKVQLPQKDPTTGKKKEIFFGADNIKLSHGGGLIGDAQLVLLGDFSIPFNGGNLLLTLKGGQGMNVTNNQYQTYAKLECGGIKEIGLAADVLFPKNMLVALDNNLKADTTKRVKGSFSTIVTDWNDILAEFNMQPFAIKGLEKFAISVDKAVFDFSDVKNSPDVIFPVGYENLIPGNEQLWRGVYINKVQITLPKEFQKRGTTQRVSFEANQMLVDNLGLTGNFAANNILQSGSASGWEFSVDKFAIDIKANHLKAAGFEGYIALPLTKRQGTDSLKKTAFEYKAIISPGNQYLMRVNTASNLKFDIWQATAQLDSGSYVELLVRNDQFRPKAVLNGSLNIEVSKSNNTEANGKSIATIKGIKFQILILQTEAPYIQADYFGYEGDATMGNFPIVINKIGLSANSNLAKLEIAVTVNIMPKKLSANTDVSIVGVMEQDGEMYHYVYQKIDLGELGIKADFGGFKIEGGVKFNRNDPIMGTGFAGGLKMTINSIGSPLIIDAKAAFGSSPLEIGQTETFRYWFVDALATGLRFSSGSINITGLGGGASYHMQKKSGMIVEASYCPTKIGFDPDATKGLGLRATVLFNVASKEITKGEAGLEMMFSSSGGLANIGLFGKAYFMPSANLKKSFNDVANVQNTLLNNLTAITKTVAGKDSTDFIKKLGTGKFTDMAKEYYPKDTTTGMGNDGQIYADAGINYDFQNKVLHANLDLFVNVAGGIIHGRASGNRAGWAVMHFAPDEWYVHLGTPTDRLGLKIGIGSVSAEAGGYFMVGTKIPASSPPPPIVADILGVQMQELDNMRDLNALGDGRGFAFGADFSINTGDLRFLMFYASFQAGLGFDIMLKDYGEAHCVGSNEPIGMNGWYANGQAYAYLQGELGIQVKLMFIKKKMPIIKAGAAVLLQAKLPNPSWFRGYVGGYFSVLGGLVKGRFRFKVTIGQECEIVDGGPLEGVKVIADFSPADKATQVDVFAAPQAVFNMPVEKPFNIDDDQGTKTYRIKLDAYTVTKDGQAIAGELKWNSRNDAVLFESAEILPPNANIKAKVKVKFEQQNGSTWQTVYDNGVAATEEKEISFTTGLAPDNIPLTNIAYSYPVVDQKFFYTKEYNQSYLKLKRGQAYLFNSPQYQQQAQFVVGTNAPANNAFEYDSTAKKVNLNLPNLQSSQSYTYSLMGILQGGASNNVYQQIQNVTTDSNDVQIADNKAGAVVTSNKPHIFLTYNFATSQYNTFKDKMEAKTMQHPIYEIILSDVGALQADINGQEAFDKTELLGSEYTGDAPLVQPVATLTDNWFTQNINPLIYADYPPALGITVNRDTAELSLPPVKALDAMTWYLQMTESNPTSGILSTRIPHRYYLGYYYKTDFSDLQYKVVNKYVNNPAGVPENLYRFITSSFPLMKSGKYKVQYRYVLPGKLQGSVQEFEFENPVQ